MKRLATTAPCSSCTFLEPCATLQPCDRQKRGCSYSCRWPHPTMDCHEPSGTPLLLVHTITPHLKNCSCSLAEVMATSSSSFTPLSQAHQYPYPPASAPPNTHSSNDPGPPSSSNQSYSAQPETFSAPNAPGVPLLRSSAIQNPSQLQYGGFSPDNSTLSMNAYPPPPNAPPTPAYTPMSQSSSIYPTPPQHNPQTYPPQWSGNGQPKYYQSANAPLTPVHSQYTPYSPTRTEECRNQASCQAPANLPPTPQYTPAAYGFGGSVPQAPGRYETSYFPQQQQNQSQSPQTQPAPFNSILPPAYGQNPTVTFPYVTDSVQLDLSKLSLNERQPALIQTVQHPGPAQTQSSIPADQPQNAPQGETELQQEYTQPPPSKTYPQTSQYGAHSAVAQFPPPPPPPPPYSLIPQADPTTHSCKSQEILPQQSQTILFQQQQQYEQQPQYQQQQLQQQAQAYVPNPNPYHSNVQHQQYTQVQVQNPVMGLQQPQYAQAQIQQYQQVQPYRQVQSSYGQEAPPGILAHKPGKDDQQTGKVTRFLGDTLVGRFARSSVSTVTTTLKMPAVLSPWGDNNPVTLPNVRYRDAALFGTFAIIGAPLVDGMSDVVTNSFGAEHFISDVVSSGAGFITGNTIVKYGVFQIVEQAIDKGVLEHVLPEVEKTMRTTTAKTLQVSIKHKLMGVEADIRMHGSYPASNSMACEKGWFAPYLFASSRTPVIRRSEDFAMAQFFKPYLIGTSPIPT